MTPRANRCVVRRARWATSLLVTCALALSCAPVPGNPPRVTGSTLLAEIHRALEEVPNGRHVRAILVQQGSRRVLEHYRRGSAADYAEVESVSKAILSTLVGIAIDEGLIWGVQETLGELLPAYANEMLSTVRDVTLDDLLTMRWGVLRDNTDLGPMPDDPRPHLPELVNDHTRGGPGGPWHYSNTAAQIVVSVLEEVTGGALIQYARTRLFDPLGIDTRPASEPVGPPFDFNAYQRAGFAWPVYRNGTHLGWGLMTLRARDLLKLGELFLAGGRWDGEQIVSREWVRTATASHVVTEREPVTGYGYFWWTAAADGSKAFLAEGYGGQLVEVVPARKLVVVFSTPLDLSAPWKAAVSPDALVAVVDDVIAPHFPAR